MQRLPLGLLVILGCLAAIGSIGCGTPSFLITPVGNTNQLEEDVVQPAHGWGAGKVAIIAVDGMMANARSGGLLQPTENLVSKFTQELEQAERDPAVRAVVLRVNSPGGTVTSADTLYELVMRFKQRTHKPVVAAGQEVMASGAYYLSCAADRVIAQPTSVVGSIGVIFQAIQFDGAMAKLGIRETAIKSGSLKDMGSPFKSLTPEEADTMQQMVDEYFTRFMALVRRSRPVQEAPLAQLADYRRAGYAGLFSGRVFSGQRAMELGLIDQTGMLEDAIDQARTMAHAPGAAAVLYKRPFGYGGSIYASTDAPSPRSDVLHLEVPGADAMLPGGFYYVWKP